MTTHTVSVMPRTEDDWAMDISRLDEFLGAQLVAELVAARILSQGDGDRNIEDIFAKVLQATPSDTQEGLGEPTILMEHLESLQAERATSADNLALVDPGSPSSAPNAGL